ncbi:MAG: plasmid mobilization protein [Mycobacteriales bacterium]
MEKMPEHLTDAEVADWQYAHRAEMDVDLEVGEIIAVEYPETISVTMSFRAPAQEAQAIRHAAAERGMSLSEWIRAACETATVPGFDRFQRKRDKALEAAISDLQRDVERVVRAAA